MFGCEHSQENISRQRNLISRDPEVWQDVTCATPCAPLHLNSRTEWVRAMVAHIWFAMLMKLNPLPSAGAQGPTFARDRSSSGLYGFTSTFRTASVSSTIAPPSSWHML